VHRNTLVSHLSVNDPAVQQRVALMAARVRQHTGIDSITARQSAYVMLDGAVTRQATLLSYMDVFLWVGVMFLVFVPVVLIFIKSAKNKISLADAAH